MSLMMKILFIFPQNITNSKTKLTISPKKNDKHLRSDTIVERMLLLLRKDDQY